MRDGVRLATDVYLPAAPGPFSTVLVRLPYDKNSRYVFMDVVAARVTAAGYAVVVQDVRGKCRSEGEALGSAAEAHDGYDTLSWIAASGWSDGAVGMFGDSYCGFTQYAAASTGHPALRAIVPRVTTTNLGANESVRGDGVADIPWGTSAAYLLQFWTGPYVNEREPDWTRDPLTDAFEAEFAALGARSRWYDITIPHPVPGRMYPEGAPEAARPVPTLHCVGWWDNLAIAHLRDIAMFASTPGWAPLQYLWLDSTDHENCHIDEAETVGASTGHDSDDVTLGKMTDT